MSVVVLKAELQNLPAAPRREDEEVDPEMRVPLCGRLTTSDGRHATLSAVIKSLSAPDRLDPAEKAEALQALQADAVKRRPYADTRLVELAGGMAIASLIFGQFDLPPEETGVDTTVTIPTFRAEFLVPTPDWNAIIVLDVSTTDEQAWPEVAQEAVRIAHSLRFVADGESAREGEHLLPL